MEVELIYSVILVSGVQSSDSKFEVAIKYWLYSLCCIMYTDNLLVFYIVMCTS